MTTNWYSILSGPFGSVFQFFLDYFHASTKEGVKTIFLSLASSFTPSLFFLNFVLLLYFFFFLKQDWQKHLFFLLVGKGIGMYGVIFFMNVMPDRQELILLNVMEGMVYLLFVGLAIIGKHIQKKSWVTLMVGFFTSIILGPTVYALLRTAPYLFSLNISSVEIIYPALFASVNLSILFILTAVCYAFELDKRMVNAPHHVAFIGFFLFGLNGLAITFL